MEDQVQQESAVLVAPASAKSLSPLQQEAVIYAIVAKVFAILVGTGLGALGALIGNALRKAVHPDAVWTTGGFWALMWVKVFWKWGPQTIGMAAGTFIGIALVIHR
jgi:hypothetical protein